MKRGLSLDPPTDSCRSFPVRFLPGEFSEMSSGAGFLPLACSAALPGSWLGDWGSEMAVAAVGGGPVPGWSGCRGGRAAGRAEEFQPFVLAVPAFGQVQGDVTAAVPGDAGSDRDQVAADGRGPGFGEVQA